jgi:predicted CopG family antitoxin
MARQTGSPNSPLTFDLPIELYESLVKLQESTGAGSVSEVIRMIIEGFDFAGIDAVRSEHRQISVRIDSGKRKQLLKLAKQKRTSAGELLRQAIVGFKPATKTKKSAKK